VPLLNGPPQITLTLRRVNTALPATVHLTVTDGCGDWPTFVGGGPSAFLRATRQAVANAAGPVPRSVGGGRHAYATPVLATPSARAHSTVDGHARIHLKQRGPASCGAWNDARDEPCCGAGAGLLSNSVG
jgi:hypothetical protein